MYEAIEHWNQYKKEKALAKAKKELDKLINKLVAKNGTTEI